MGTILTYVIKVNSALIVFYLLYMLLFRKDTFIRLKRYYFLSAIIFSLVYPLFTLSALGSLIDLTKPVETETAIYIGNIAMEGVLVEEIGEEHASTPIDWAAVAKNILLAGTLLLSIRLVWQLYLILKMKSESEKKSFLGHVFYQLKDEIAPFSFFNWIFIHTGNYTENELKQILLHEHTHTRQWHSLDILLAEMLRIAFWWNPITWLMKRNIAINLEYLADEAVLKEGIASKEYQYHLLQMTNHETAVQIVNNFNVSQLKQRIIMMNTNKSPMRKLAKYLLVLPLTLLLITVNSAYATESSNEKQEKLVAQPQEPQKKVSKNDKVFEKVDKIPEFPGGQKGIMKFLSENIKYPVEAQKNGKQGRVIVNFIVEKDGSTSNLKVVRGVDPLLDAEALRVLSLMPKWTPGELNNEIVRVKFTLPIVFRLQGDEKAKTANEKNIENDEVFVIVEQQPEFPGGIEAMMKYLSDNIKYPEEAHKNNIQGRVIVSFVINKDGSLSDIKVVRGQDPLLDAEAVRVISAMPNWKPGMQRGQAVNVKYTLPIVFSLQGDKKEVPTEENDEVFVVVEQQPEFPGGIEAMMKYLSDNIKYPEEAHKNNIQGRVIVNFVVNKDGSLSDVNIVRGQDPLLDAEAVRVISTMPNWKPGMQRGQAVNVRFTLPITFSLQGDKKETSTKENEEPLVGFTPSRENLSKFFEYVSENVKYPVIAQENGIMGLVKATYDVNSDGEVSNIRIIEGADPALDAELTRVIKTMPKDIALIRSGGKDASNIEISTLFHLQNENTVPPPPSPTDIVVVGYGKPTK